MDALHGIRIVVCLGMAIAIGLHILERRTLVAQRVSGRGRVPSGQSDDRDIPLPMNRRRRSRGRDTQIIVDESVGIDVASVGAWKSWWTIWRKLWLDRNMYRRIHPG